MLLLQDTGYPIKRIKDCIIVSVKFTIYHIMMRLLFGRKPHDKGCSSEVLSNCFWLYKLFC